MSGMTAGADGLIRPRRRRTAGGFTLLRSIAGESPVHRLWAGTKLIAVGVLGITLSLRPSWAGIAVVAAAVLLTARLARIPRGALPRLPAWFWATMGVGVLLTLSSGGAPEVHLLGRSAGLGGVESFCRFAAFGATLIGASTLVGWTTPLAEVAPALGRLGRPLRWLHLPVDEWVVAVALCVRCLPLLVDEMHTLVGARRLRPRPRLGWAPRVEGSPRIGGSQKNGSQKAGSQKAGSQNGSQEKSSGGDGRLSEGTAEGAPDGGREAAHAVVSLGNEVVDLLTAALAVALRRSGEMAMAIEARGGVAAARRGPARGAEARLRRADVVALVAVAALSAAVFLLPA